MTTRETTQQHTIGGRIRWARERKGISQERLAEKIGTSRRHMIRIEKDQHRPGVDFIARIAEETGQPPEFFSDDDEEEDAAVKLTRATGLLSEALLELARQARGDA